MSKILITLLILITVIILSVILFVFFYPGIGKTPGKKQQAEYESRTEYFYDGQFHNKNEVKTIESATDDKSDRLVPADPIPVIKSDSIPSAESDELCVTWFGHSSLLVQLGEANILIDPVFSKRCSPVQFAGPKRFSDIPIEPENLPTVDILVLSHDHYDHTDRNLILKIDEKVKKYIVPLGVETYLIGWGISKDKIETVAWYDEITVGNINITSTPAQHFTGRNPFKRNASWWCGYIFSNDYYSVYYSGDGGYSDVFKEINDKYGKIDLALMECGQYGKGWPAIHMFPEEVVEASVDLNADWYIPVHWGAYCICNNDWDDSIIRYSEGADKAGINYATPLIGERVNYKEIQNFNSKWWTGIK